MLQILIHEQACRGCKMCVDVCPTDVFCFDEDKKLSTVAEAEDCIACLSCVYACPSKAITHKDYYAVRNFYREIDFSRRVGRFL